MPKIVYLTAALSIALISSLSEVALVRTAAIAQEYSIVPLSLIYFQLDTDTRILASSSILVETGDGLNPGESLSFDKVINKSHLVNAVPSVTEFKVTKYE